MQWLVRDEAGTGHQVPGRLALTSLRASEVPGGTVYGFFVSESQLATGARRHLVEERGVPKAHLDFIGYWRHGHSSP